MIKDRSFVFWCGLESMSSFISVLQENNISFKKNKIIQKNVTPTDMTFVVEIIQAIGGLGIAGVLIAWINQKTSRTVKVLKSDKTIEIITKGYSAKDIDKIIQKANHIALLEE